MWHRRVPQRENEDEIDHGERVRKFTLRRLIVFYKKQHYSSIRAHVYGRVVDPITANPNDRLIANPNPLPLAEGGGTPPSTIRRDAAGTIGVEEEEEEEEEGEEGEEGLEETGNYTPL